MASQSIGDRFIEEVEDTMFLPLVIAPDTSETVRGVRTVDGRVRVLQWSTGQIGRVSDDLLDLGDEGVWRR
jgi:hypothetical protein